MSSSPIIILLNIGAAAALLVWAVRLVRTGFQRALGDQLRIWLKRSTSNRITSLASGAGAAIVLQSSTAVAILMASFVSAGAIGGATGLAIILGADLGSAIVAKILNSGISALAPILMLAGVVLFLRSEKRRARQIGRILVGLALIFLSLDLLGTASAPLVDSRGTALVMHYLAGDPLSAFIVSCIFAWLIHSSVAAVLLYATMASQGILPVEAAFAMVLGANLGGSLIAFVLTLQSEAQVRRIIMANVLVRGGGALVILFFMPLVAEPGYLGATPADQTLNLHIAFNVLLLAVAAPFAGIIHGATKWLIPVETKLDETDELKSVLDRDALAHPKRALSCAIRELVHMGGLIEAMERRAIGLFENYDAAAADRIKADHKRIEELSLGLRIYLAEIRASDEKQKLGTRAIDLAGIGANLEAASDMVARKIVSLASRKNSEKVEFSEKGWRDIQVFDDAVLQNIQLGLSVLMNENPALARDLIRKKDDIRALAQELEERHLQRLQQGLTETIETSSIHLDLIRSLKVVNASFSMIAYPILQNEGELLGSRLASSQEATS